MRVGGDGLDEPRTAVRQGKEFSLAIGDRTAEEIKIQMGSMADGRRLTADIRSRDLISGLRTIQLTTERA